MGRGERIGLRLRVAEPGAPLALEEFAVPAPGPGEALVRLSLAGLNHLDLWVQKGIPGIPYPLTPGSDGVGRVEAVGEGVTGLARGDRVLLSPGVGDHLAKGYALHGEHLDGTYATHLARPAHLWLPVPAGLPDELAACCALAHLTAHTMLARRARLVAGETVLVWGAASGVGHAAGQVARATGARTIGTARAGKAAALAGLGWEALVDPEEEDVVAAVRAATSGRGADVVVEHPGQATWGRSLRALARNGRLVTCGATTGHLASVNLRHLFIKNQSILGSTMGSAPDLHEVVAQAGAGVYKPLVDKVFPLAEAALAHARLAAGKAVGKVLLDLATPGNADS